MLQRFIRYPELAEFIEFAFHLWKTPFSQVPDHFSKEERNVRGNSINFQTSCQI